MGKVDNSALAFWHPVTASWWVNSISLFQKNWHAVSPSDFVDWRNSHARTKTNFEQNYLINSIKYNGVICWMLKLVFNIEKKEDIVVFNVAVKCILGHLQDIKKVGWFQ